MKKLLALLILVSLTVFSLASCGEKDNTQLRIGYLAGPTGMGMAKLVHDNGGFETGNEKYSFKKYTDTSLAKPDFTKGKVDVICLPTNEAAEYFNTVDSDISVLAINTLGSLFLLTDKNTTVNSFAELEGKTVYTCKNGTPRIVLEYLLEVSGVNATVSYEYDGKEIPKPAALGKLIESGSLPIAVAPEPIVTSTLLAITKNGDKNIEYSVDLNLSEVWDDNCDYSLAMGCVVARNDFINEHPTVIKAFLKEYKASIEFINNKNNLDVAAAYIVEASVMGAEPDAKKALSNLYGSIAYVDGKLMKNTLESFYTAIEIKLPEAEFYYED